MQYHFNTDLPLCHSNDNIHDAFTISSQSRIVTLTTICGRHIGDMKGNVADNMRDGRRADFTIRTAAMFEPNGSVPPRVRHVIPRMRPVEDGHPSRLDKLEVGGFTDMTRMYTM